jgi:co-chaperonin GroES (HSP10)
MSPDQNIPKSRYLDFFQQNKEVIREHLEIIGDVILVEKVKFPEARTASGIYITDYKGQINTLNADKPHFYRVLMPGEGYYDDTTKESQPLNAQQGDIILVGSISVKIFSSFPLLEAYEADSIGITRESEIQMRFKGEDNFVRFLGDFNKAVKAKMVESSS